MMTVRFRSMRALPAVAAIIVLLAAGCKTNEANYRQAYETAVNKNRHSSGADSTIYANMHDNKERMSDLVVDGDSLPMRTEYIGYTDEGGASRETVKKFNVVVGRFRQVFNAREMRARLIASGYSDAFIVNTREPLYYVCTATCQTAEEAAVELGRVKNDKSIVLRPPLPFILRPGHLAR